MVPAFLYGFGCRAGRLPPNDFLKRAWDPVCPVVDILHANDVEHYSSRAYISAGDVSSTAEVPDPNPTPLNNVEILSLSMADGYRLFDAGDLRVTLQNVPPRVRRRPRHGDGDVASDGRTVWE